MAELGIKPRHSYARSHMLNPGPSSKDKNLWCCLEKKVRHSYFPKEKMSQHAWRGDMGAWWADWRVPLPSLGHGVAPWGCLRDWLSIHLRWVCPGFLRGRACCSYPVPARNIRLLQVSLPKWLTPLIPKGQLDSSHRGFSAQQPKEKWAFNDTEQIWPKLVR